MQVNSSNHRKELQKTGDERERERERKSERIKIKQVHLRTVQLKTFCVYMYIVILLFHKF